MRCPICRHRASVERIQYSELGPDNALIPINRASLSCGCTVALESLPRDVDAGWDVNVRRRIDENLRSVFG